MTRSRIFVSVFAPQCGGKQKAADFMKDVLGDRFRHQSLGAYFRQMNDPVLDAIMSRRELVPDCYVWSAVDMLLEELDDSVEYLYIDGLPRSRVQFEDFWEHPVLSHKMHRRVGVMLNRSLPFCLKGLNSGERQSACRNDDTPENVKKEWGRFQEEVLIPWRQTRILFDASFEDGQDSYVEECMGGFVTNLAHLCPAVA